MRVIDYAFSDLGLCYLGLVQYIVTGRQLARKFSRIEWYKFDNVRTNRH